MLRKKSSKHRKNINASSTIDFFLHIRADEAVFLQNLFCALAQFHFLKHSPKVNIVSPSCAIDAIWCMMLCYAKWCDYVMLCEMMWWCYVMQNDIYAKDTHSHPHSGIHNLFAAYFLVSPLIFGVSALTFRCKFCIPLGTSFELLRLLFQRYSRWLFALRLIFQRYLALHSLWNDFWAENLHCAPLGTTFCIFDKLTLRSVERLFVASEILVMWFLVARSLRNDFCASATFWTSWVCGEDIFHLWQKWSYYKKLKMTRKLGFQ
jgi:hypothetical protein